MKWCPHSVAGVLLATALVCLGLPRPAEPHAQLVRSEPPDHAVLRSAPSRAELWFDELLDRGFHSVSVRPVGDLSGATGASLATGKPQVDPADPTHLTVGLQALPPGKYVIDWRVLSRDGHSAAGRLWFEVRGPA
ncbi:MAG TPA: copper resistance protein CopC [Candidatus Sulfotelmatobacter sp.]|nr:copper resistance protein CopC [Candidatus Sulfotelmatobacter sp.]